MVDYNLYKNAIDAINETINNKQHEIADIEEEIRNLKNTRRMMDEEFKNNMSKKESYLG